MKERAAGHRRRAAMRVPTRWVSGNRYARRGILEQRGACGKAARDSRLRHDLAPIGKTGLGMENLADGSSTGPSMVWSAATAASRTRIGNAHGPCPVPRPSSALPQAANATFSSLNAAPVRLLRTIEVHEPQGPGRDSGAISVLERKARHGLAYVGCPPSGAAVSPEPAGALVTSAIPGNGCDPQGGVPAEPPPMERRRLPASAGTASWPQIGKGEFSDAKTGR